MLFPRAVAAALPAVLAAAPALADGVITSWGANAYGQRNPPADLGSVTQITAGRFHTLAIRSDGTLAAW